MEKKKTRMIVTEFFRRLCIRRSDNMPQCPVNEESTEPGPDNSRTILFLNPGSEIGICRDENGTVIALYREGRHD